MMVKAETCFQYFGFTFDIFVFCGHSYALVEIKVVLGALEAEVQILVSCLVPKKNVFLVRKLFPHVYNTYVHKVNSNNCDSTYEDFITANQVSTRLSSV